MTNFSYVFLVEKVLKTKGDKVSIKWLGFNYAHNSKIKMTDLLSIFILFFVLHYEIKTSFNYRLFIVYIGKIFKTYFKKDMVTTSFLFFLLLLHANQPNFQVLVVHLPWIGINAPSSEEGNDQSISLSVVRQQHGWLVTI